MPIANKIKNNIQKLNNIFDKIKNELKEYLGTFDEFESHSSFIEALNAWREKPAKILSKPVQKIDQK